MSEQDSTIVIRYNELSNAGCGQFSDGCLPGNPFML